MNQFPIARPRPMTGRARAQFTLFAMAAFVLLVNLPGPAVAQQLPQRFFVLTMDEANSKKTFAAMDALAVIERDGTSWTQFPQEIQRAGRLSPDTTKYAWVQAGSEEKPTSMLQIVDFRKNAPPIKVPFGGVLGHCYWSRDGRELVVSTVSTLNGDRNYQTWRASADGSKTVKMPIPTTEFVHDWSRDGRWFVTTSVRDAAGEQRISQNLQDVRIIHPDGTGNRVFRVGPGPLNKRRNAGPISTKTAPVFSPDSRSLVWAEFGVASSGRQPADVNLIPPRIMVQRLTEDTPKEVTRAGGDQMRFASMCWSPDSRSLVLHLQNNSARRATDSQFEVYDLSGKLIRSVSANGVPNANSRRITYMVDCR
jgi:Tol biopolymer transport system component